ncbi:MAG: 16S rRNA (cytosine(1402)-N(4))-methyltransferase, partial [Microcystis sp.]
MNQDFPHISVLSQELIAGLNIQPGGHYLDLTLGGGGHSRLLLEAHP